MVTNTIKYSTVQIYVPTYTVLYSTTHLYYSSLIQYFTHRSYFTYRSVSYPAVPYCTSQPQSAYVPSVGSSTSIMYPTMTELMLYLGVYVLEMTLLSLQIYISLRRGSINRTYLAITDLCRTFTPSNFWLVYPVSRNHKAMGFE